MSGQLTAERWLAVKAIVAEALDIELMEARDAFVHDRCSDDRELLGEVESLLAQTTGPMEDYAARSSGAVRSDAAPLAVGRRIGAYAIIRELGRGGMGAVYLAGRADQEFKKEVAIKLLKRGTDTDEVLRRFRAERDILARLEHPNIARLIDGGTTDDGLPYFVMEYVIGSPVTTYCDVNKLTVEARLRLFLKICAAVQFAHQNLIVHRDLKPANILVTPDGEPKLLDFGIAKLLAPDDIALSITLVDQQRLTAGYASPEQVRGDPITTVSDVYALGALLYEMLSGTAAHRFSHAHPTSTELLKVVGELTPVRPSAAAADPQIARKLRGDLDNIVLQALRKEPSRRYTGVGAFADDVRLHLGSFPVRARKDTLSYRTSKFVQRNRLGVAAGLLVLLALIAGIGATAWESHVARAERRKAEKRFNQVRELAHSVLFDYHDAIAALPGSTSVRQRLVQDALKYLDNLEKEAGEDPSLLREIAGAYEKVAAVQGGVASSTTGAALTASNLGDTKGAVASSHKALALRRKIARLKPMDRQPEQDLGNSLLAVAGIYSVTGPPDKSAEHNREAAAIFERLLARNPDNEGLLDALGTAYLGLAKALGVPGVPNLGATKGAFAYLDKAQAIAEKLVTQHPNDVNYKQSLGSLHNARGLMFSATSQRAEQLSENQKAVALSRELVAVDPGNTFFRRELAIQLGNVGSVMVQMKDKAGALTFFREALAIYESLAASDPSDVSIRRNLGVGYRNVGVAVGETDRTEALLDFNKAISLFAAIAAKEATNYDVRRQWAYSYLALSRFQSDLLDFEAAVASALEGIKIDEALISDSPSNASAVNTLGLLYTQLGAYESKWAVKTESDKALAASHWLKGKEAFTKALSIYQGMKDKGTLSAADAGKIDEIGNEIAKCDVALK